MYSHFADSYFITAFDRMYNIGMSLKGFFLKVTHADLQPLTLLPKMSNSQGMCGLWLGCDRSMLKNQCGRHHRHPWQLWQKLHYQAAVHISTGDMEFVTGDSRASDKAQPRVTEKSPGTHTKRDWVYARETARPLAVWLQLLMTAISFQGPISLALGLSRVRSGEKWPGLVCSPGQ